MQRYYIPWREGVNPNSYAGAAIEANLKSLFKNVRTADQYGWRNQPKVFTFSSDLELLNVNKIIAGNGYLSQYLAHFPNARVKDW